ncbi:hypothetical protein CBL_08279 [Carabus blaptoides fortunei]
MPSNSFITYWLNMSPLTLAFLCIITQNTVLGQEFFMKTVPRNNRANDAPKNFENFFFKASKSVPRIGRRDMDTKYYEDDTGFYRPNGLYPKILKKLDSEKAKDPQMSFEDFFRKSLKSVPRIGRRDKMDTQYYEDGTGFYRPNGLYPKILKKFESNLNELPWDDLADQIEYNPEYLMSPHLLAQVGLREQEFTAKRAQKTKEIPECRIQPDV